MTHSTCWMVSFALMISTSSICNAASRIYDVSNRSAAVITEITATNIANPADAVSFSLQGPIAMASTATASFDLPADECLFDLSFERSTAAPIFLQKVDLCNIDGIVVE